jgi:large subunit ribosomal protein L23
MNPYDVVIRPLLSEKSVSIREKESKYVFLVRNKATKCDVKSAIEKLFSVDVTDVNTAILRGKIKRRGVNVSKSSNKKKAYVTLKAGQKIKIFDDQ